MPGPESPGTAQSLEELQRQHGPPEEGVGDSSQKGAFEGSLRDVGCSSCAPWKPEGVEAASSGPGGAVTLLFTSVLLTHKQVAEGGLELPTAGEAWGPAVGRGLCGGPAFPEGSMGVASIQFCPSMPSALLASGLEQR